MAPKSEGTVTITRSDGTVVCERCARAWTPLTRMRGLLGRSDLPSEEGIWLRPASSIHTHFMRFAIDVVFLDRSSRVVRIVRELPPWRFAGARGAHSVLELRAGECERRGLGVGDELAGDSSG